MTTDELLETIRLYVAERFPAKPAVRVRIDIAGDDSIRLPIPHVPAAPTRGDTAGPRITDADRTILEAVAVLGGDPNGPEIARAAGYPYDSHVRMRLSLLRRRGLLGGQSKGAGYPLTDLGAEVLSAGP